MQEFLFQPKGIYYRTNTFRSDRPTIVFVHGLSGSSSAWLPYEKTLESTFNLVSFDLRGHGKSKKPLLYDEYRMEDFAEDLYELTEHLNIEKFILLGHSLGAFVVLDFLRKHQEKVSQVIFLAPNFSVGKMLSAKIIVPFLWLGISMLKKIPFSGRAGGHVDYTRFPNTGDWNIPRMIADIRNTTLRVYLYATRQSYNFDAEDFLGNIYIPTLIIHGKKDTIFPVQYGVLMANTIPNTKLILLEDADHILALNNEPEISQAINAFIDKTTKAQL